MNNYIIALFDAHAPLRLIKPNSKSKPYITYNIKEMIKLKNKAHRKYLKSRMQIGKNYYLDIKNYANLAIKREKTAYMKFQLNSSNKDQKKLWNNLKKWGIHNPCTKSLDTLLSGNINLVNDYYTYLI